MIDKQNIKGRQIGKSWLSAYKILCEAFELECKIEMIEVYVGEEDD